MAKYSKMGAGAQCPKCGSYSCHPITETQFKDGGYGVFKGLCGYLILGPVGLICGLCGHKAKYKQKTYWVCGSCGRKFKL